MVIPMSFAAWFLLPKHRTPPKAQRRGVDIPGVLTLTACLILFVYSISDAADAGWGSPQVITTMVLSITAFVAFFVVESIMEHPALPPKTWRNKNFTPLFFYAHWWRLGCQLQLISVFPNLWYDSPLIAALRCLPIGVAGGVASYLVGRFLPRLTAKWVLVGAQILTATGSAVRIGGFGGALLVVRVPRDGDWDVRAGICTPSRQKSSRLVRLQSTIGLRLSHVSPSYGLRPVYPPTGVEVNRDRTQFAGTRVAYEWANELDGTIQPEHVELGFEGEKLRMVVNITGAASLQYEPKEFSVSAAEFF
ncbi:hypothetical protein EYR38_002002 [Pleurotus pulmonarius]|nr:hypothetical protein EYR38_002002 [Pleurotus pulmonarius]